MLQALVQLIAALAICYGVSRVLLRKAPFPADMRGLLWVHAASWAIVLVAVFALKFPVDGFDRSTPFLLAFCQGAWFLLDRLRLRYPGGGPA